MEVNKAKRSVSVPQRKTTKSVENVRSPLIPSEKNNAAPSTGCKLRTRDTSSRHKSGTAYLTNSSVSRNRCPSPTVSRTIPTSELQSSRRSLSAERTLCTAASSRSSASQSPCSRLSTSSSPSRPCTPVRDTVAEMHGSSKRLIGLRTMDGLWPSIRNLSSSLNLETIPKRDKDTMKPSRNLTSEKKRTPLRGKSASDQLENSKPLENSHPREVVSHKRSGMLSTRLSAGAIAITRSVDLTDKHSRSFFSSTSSRGTSLPRKSGPDGPRSLPKKSINDSKRRMSLDGVGKAVLDLGSNLSLSTNSARNTTSLVSSNRTRSLPSPGLHRPSSPSKSSMCPSSASNVSLRTPSPSKISLRSSSPCKSLPRPPSPSKAPLSSTTLRSAASPSRTRPPTPSTSSVSGTSSSVISYIVDVHKVKKNANHVENIHQLRLLYNRYLQWRFVNARAEAALSMEKMTSKNALHSVWISSTKLLDSIVLKRINLQQIRQAMKLDLVLKEQIRYLEEWASLEREHCTLLTGAVEALQASIICLPVTGKARADVLSVKDAISSAVDVMQIMGSSICYLLSMVEGTYSLISELANIAVKGRAMLDECRDLLALTAALQVQEFSLRSHLLQLKQDYGWLTHSVNHELEVQS